MRGGREQGRGTRDRDGDVVGQGRGRRKEEGGRREEGRKKEGGERVMRWGGRDKGRGMGMGTGMMWDTNEEGGRRKGEDLTFV